MNDRSIVKRGQGLEGQSEVCPSSILTRHLLDQLVRGVVNPSLEVLVRAAVASVERVDGVARGMLCHEAAAA